MTTPPSLLMLVRHGQSLANLAFAEAEATGRLDAGVPLPDTDVDLSPLGQHQTTALGRWLAQHPEHQPDLVFCSPFQRAQRSWQCARQAAATAGVVLPHATIDPRLGDRHMGRFELMTNAAITARFPAEAARRASLGEYEYRPPHGESFADMASRLAPFLTDLPSLAAGRRVLVMAHDATVLLLRLLIQRRPPTDIVTLMATDPVANGSITWFRHQSTGLALTAYNTTNHLPPTTPKVPNTSIIGQ